MQIFGSGLICPKGSNILRAEIQRALRRAPRQLRRLRLGLQTRRGSNHSTAHVSESNSRSNVFQISRTSVCVSNRCLHSLLLEMGNQCRKTTLVAHFRGSTLQFCAEPQDLRKSTRVCRVVIGWRPLWRIKFSLERFSDSVANLFASPAVGKFSRASSAGGRPLLQ